MASFDPTVANSNGYFKDPGTRQDLTGNEPRVIKCSIDDTGKLIWPQVQFSDGSVGKIVYKLWTAEEKAIYKQYRENGKQKIKPAVQKPVADTVVHEESKPEAPVKEINYEGSVPSGKMLAYIRNCDKVIGVWNWDGMLWDLLTVEGSRSYMPVARCLIPKEDRIRLGIV
jgi:hypothetical protein